jgi:dTDP-4-amino-4,6-dideoxygalactose transaminase
MKVPFVNLRVQYQSIKNEVDVAILKCLEEATFVGGDIVKGFEEEFAKYLGLAHCVGCGSGTDALELALMALGIGKGDEVIVPAYTWISTAETVTSVGATPVFVDINPEFYTIDVTKIEEKITNKTKAIIPVHFYGLPAEMDEIIDLSKKYNLKIIEDCAQAHGAEYKGKKVGNFGDLACFSFYPGKNLGAYGDGGAVTGNDKILIDNVRMRANHGQLVKHDHIIDGRNSRLDTMHAAVLSIKLKHLDSWNSRRIANANLYFELLRNIEVEAPKLPNHSKHIYHIFAIQVDNRDEVIDVLREFGVEASIHYPKALPFLIPYLRFNYSSVDFPVAYKVSTRILS